ncbi:EAL domain-containing protein [Pseudomonas sp. RIT-To-2]|uniref:EAL domain-containing protein n=1 Tax=Pseudomonas sp. RIT-To-2 TaxID=3462541 RepID=UPI002413929B
MPFFPDSPRPCRPLRLLAPWLAGALPLVLGVGILYWQAERDLQASANNTANQALAQFDLMLDNVAAAANDLVPLAGQPCAEVTLALREQVTRRPFVRSTNLALDDHLYCSSLFGDFSEPVNPGDYVDGRLWLMDGNPVTPGQALLVYREANDEQTALATLDGYHLANALRMIGREQPVLLQVGNSWLAPDGSVHDAPAPTFEVAPTQLASSRYPLSVSTGYPAGATWQWITSHPLLLALLAFLALLAGGLCRWLLRRAHSPRAELARALDANEFIPYYQPVVHGVTGRWAGVEVLMRWQHPREGLVRPDLFIPFAEHSGLIVPMTRQLMHQAAADLRAHAERFEDGFHVGINITAEHCQDLALLDDCRDFLAGFAPGRITLVLELTERELIRPTAVTHQLFEALHNLGVTIAIDDFGTGHSSLAYLREFKVDFLKIDQSFIATIGKDALSGHIVDSIIELSGKLDLGIVAEGVEEPVQRDYLVQRQVEFLQGYLFGRPMPLQDLIDHLPAD